MIIEKTLNFQNKKIFYKMTGEGQAVVLLHGIPFDGSLWHRQLISLTKFKFIVPDLPGSGESERIGDMTMEGMAEAVKAILENEKIPLATMIGHSLGGYISLAFAERYPDYVNGLGLFHSTTYPDSEERRATRIKAIEFIKKNGAFEFLKNSIPTLFSPHNKEKNARDIDELIKKANNFSSESLVSYYEAMLQRPNRTAILKDLKTPVLFIAGKYDTAIPINDLLEQCHLPEKSYFHILADAGHMGMLEETDKSNSFLTNYLVNLSDQS